MDLTIKAKTFELEALEFLNKRAPEVYKGKKHGFYWAAHEANLCKDDIDWEKVAKVRLENYFSGDSYEEKIPPITHLTADEEDYENLAQSMKKQFELKRSVQKAYCIRNILKWAVMTYYIEGLCNLKPDSKVADPDEKTIEEFSCLSVDEKLDVLYMEFVKIRKLMMREGTMFGGFFE